MKKFAFIFLAIPFFLSCENNESYFTGFDPITEDGIFDTMNPESAIDYYEIRSILCFDTTRYTVVGSCGINPLGSPVVYNAKGVVYTTADLCAVNNIMSVHGTKISFWDTYDEIKRFLGPVDRKSEALFIAHLNGYYFKYSDEKYGIKEVNGKYFICAFKLVSMCAPVETDKFLIEINSLGEIKILQQEVECISDGCIK